MKKIIDPIDRTVLKKELSEDIFLRDTNNGNNKVYVFSGNEKPELLREVGRVRELTFRNAGGGTGKEIDIDEFDLDPEHTHKQLIVWDPENEEIIGGYRFYFPPADSTKLDARAMVSSTYFRFSDHFMKEYFPYTMELGRSFVQPQYQSKTMGRKSLFALDNLWDGLGAIVIDHPNIKFLFGKVTMYPHFNHHARDMILHFLGKYFTDNENLVIPYEPAPLNIPEEEMDSIFTGSTFKEDYRILVQEVRKLGENVPPLINAYMGLSPTMKVFGTFINHHFGDVQETGLMITIRDIYIDKVNRHLASYREDYEL